MLPTISLAHAHIRHRRHTPKPHAFEYQMGYVLVNIDHLAEVCARSPFWSYNQFNLMSLYDKDLLTKGSNSIRDTLKEAVQQQLGQSISTTQPIYVLTLPSYLGLTFNPVSFYWIYDETQTMLQFIGVHITNTPWHERFLYCFDCARSEQNSVPVGSHEQQKTQPIYRFLLDKQFHVSPFMPMQLKYDWRFKLDQDTDLNNDSNDNTSHSAIHMQLKNHGQLVFDATMKFTVKPFPVWKQNLFPLIYPLQSIKIVWAIYWQALRLWLKRIPFFSHPASHKKFQS